MNLKEKIEDMDLGIPLSRKEMIQIRGGIQQDPVGQVATVNRSTGCMDKCDVDGSNCYDITDACVTPPPK